MVWEDEPSYYAEPDFLHFDLDVPYRLVYRNGGEVRADGTQPFDKRLSVPQHFELVHHQLTQIRNAFALAQALALSRSLTLTLTLALALTLTLTLTLTLALTLTLTLPLPLGPRPRAHPTAARVRPRPLVGAARGHHPWLGGAPAAARS